MTATQPINFSQLDDDVYLRQAQLIPHVIPISASNLWQKVKQKKFPQPTKLSTHCSAWRVGDIRAWLKNPSQEYV